MAGGSWRGEKGRAESVLSRSFAPHDGVSRSCGVSHAVLVGVVGHAESSVRIVDAIDAERELVEGGREYPAERLRHADVDIEDEVDDSDSADADLLNGAEFPR